MTIQNLPWATTVLCDHCQMITFSVREFREDLRDHVKQMGWRLTNTPGQGYKDWCPSCYQQAFPAGTSRGRKYEKDQIDAEQWTAPVTGWYEVEPSVFAPAPLTATQTKDHQSPCYGIRKPPHAWGRRDDEDGTSWYERVEPKLPPCDYGGDFTIDPEPRQWFTPGSFKFEITLPVHVLPGGSYVYGNITYATTTTPYVTWGTTGPTTFRIY